MKSSRLLNSSLPVCLAITVALLAGCSNSAGPRMGPPPVRILMKIRKHRQKEAEANATPTPSPTPGASPDAASNSSPAYSVPQATPAPGGILRGIIERRLQGQ